MDSMRGSAANAAVGGEAEPDSAEAVPKLHTSSRTVTSPYMAGTVYPYNYQDMPSREIPDGFSYHMFASRSSIPFFTQVRGAKRGLAPQDRTCRRLDAEAHAMVSPAPSSCRLS